MATQGWEKRRLVELVRRAIQRDPEITAAQLKLRFGLSHWNASRLKRQYTLSKHDEKQEVEGWEN